MKEVKIKGVGGKDAVCEAAKFACMFLKEWAMERDYGPHHGTMYAGTHINVYVYHTKTQVIADARGVGQPSNGGQKNMRGAARGDVL